MNYDYLRNVIRDNKSKNKIELPSTNKVYRISADFVAKWMVTDLKFNKTTNIIKEASIHISLNHPRIVECVNYFEENYKFYLITRFCAQGPLLFVKNKTEEQKIRYLNQIAEGIGFLHTNKIAHRDIKLDNIFIDENDDIKLGDFGYASYGEVFKDYAGTPSYVSPQIMCKTQYTSKCDIWSFGMTSYCLLCEPESNRSVNLLNFMQEIKNNNKQAHKELITKEIEALDFTGISDKSKNMILKMLSYEEEDRLDVFEIRF
jgi:serine/threonine protein kinase